MSHYTHRLSHHLSVERKALPSPQSWRWTLKSCPDEPSAGLDPRARRSLITLLHALPLTMLVSTHDIDGPRVISSYGYYGRGVVVDGSTSLLWTTVLFEAHGLSDPKFSALKSHSHPPGLSK
jgi:cobalt/nickel transport system ATP-binding protein